MFKEDLPSSGISSSDGQIASSSLIYKINNVNLSKEDVIEIVYQVEYEVG